MQIVAGSALVALAAANPDHPAPYHPAEPEYPSLPAVYNYEYGVNDGYTGASFSQKETREDYNTAGEYRVNLPDGRVQIVSYKAGNGPFVMT